MKKVSVLTVVVLCAASLVLGAAASGIIREVRAQLRPDFTVEIDGQLREFKNAQGDVVYPLLYNGTTYLPVRAIGEIMGKTVYWHEAEKRVELRDEKKATVTDADVIITEDGKRSEKTKPEVSKPKADNASSFIGEARAKEIALKKAGITAQGVVFERVELEREDGVWIYEVEFRKGYVEYDAEIRALDGAVLKFEVDRD